MREPVALLIDSMRLSYKMQFERRLWTQRNAALSEPRMSQSIFDQPDPSADQASLPLSEPLSDWLRSWQGDAAGSQWPELLFQKEAAGYASATDNWLQLSLQGFGTSAAQPSAELSLPSASQDVASAFSAAPAAAPSTNLKIAIAQALYPGIPVF
jgi:hypothetical protein